MRQYFSLKRLPLSALAVVVTALAATEGYAQVSAEVDVEGYLCREPIDAEEFQKLASTNPNMSRAVALLRFNEAGETPRCDWYDRTPMIYKGALREDTGATAQKAKYLFIGGNGGVFEVLVYETPEGDETLYSWRRTEGETG